MCFSERQYDSRRDLLHLEENISHINDDRSLSHDTIILQEREEWNLSSDSKFFLFDLYVLNQCEQYFRSRIYTFNIPFLFFIE